MKDARDQPAPHRTPPRTSRRELAGLAATMVSPAPVASGTTSALRRTRRRSNNAVESCGQDRLPASCVDQTAAAVATAQAAVQPALRTPREDRPRGDIRMRLAQTIAASAAAAARTYATAMLGPHEELS